LGRSPGFGALLGKGWKVKSVSSIAITAALACAGMQIAASVHAAEIGTVIQQEYEGALGYVPGTTSPDELKYQHPVHENEQVKTKEGGTVVKFHDTTRLAIDPHSDVVLDRFVYNPESTVRDGAINITKGVLRLTSGINPHQDNVTIGTPVASLTVRGTDVVVKVEDDGVTRVDVVKGAIKAKTCGQDPVLIKAGQSARIVGGCVPILLFNTNAEETSTEFEGSAPSSPSPPSPPEGPPSGGPPSGGPPSGGPPSGGPPSGGPPAGEPGGGTTGGGTTGGTPSGSGKPGNGFGDSRHHEGPPGQSKG
jgi:hypothetical protein